MKLAGEPPAGLKSLLRPSHSAFFTRRGRHGVGEGLSWESSAVKRRSEGVPAAILGDGSKRCGTPTVWNGAGLADVDQFKLSNHRSQAAWLLRCLV